MGLMDFLLDGADRFEQKYGTREERNEHNLSYYMPYLGSPVGEDPYKDMETYKKYKKQMKKNKKKKS